MSTDTCEERHRIDEHFACAIDAEAERAMRAHLVACEPCRAHYRRRVLLDRLDPSSARAEARIAHGLGLAAAPEKRLLRDGVATAAGFLLLAAAFLFWIRPQPPSGDFTARGGAGSGTSSLARVDEDGGDAFIQVYRVSKGSEARLAIDAVGRSDELAFTYVNALNKKRLMIFALDENKQVYWFYPAWTSDADDPLAIPIEPGPERRELPEAVAHHFVGTRLDMHAVFLDEPISVRQMEAMIAEGRMAIPGSRHLVQSFPLVP